MPAPRRSGTARTPPLAGTEPMPLAHSARTIFRIGTNEPTAEPRSGRNETNPSTPTPQRCTGEFAGRHERTRPNLRGAGDETKPTRAAATKLHELIQPPPRP